MQLFDLGADGKGMRKVDEVGNLAEKASQAVGGECFLDAVCCVFMCMMYGSDLMQKDECSVIGKREEFVRISNVLSMRSSLLS